MDGLECLICSEASVPRTGYNSFVSVRGQQIDLLWELFQIDNEQRRCDFGPNEDDSVLCCSCEEKLNQVQDIMCQLHELQKRLEELRIDIKSCVEKSNTTELLSADNCKLRSWRAKILSGSQSKANNTNSRIDEIQVAIKQEATDLELPLLSPSPPMFHDDFNSTDFSNPVSPIPVSYEAQQIDSFPSSKRIMQDLRIELRRIDEFYPALQYAATINLHMKSEAESQDFVPGDGFYYFDAESYKLPSRCRVPDCKSLKRFTNSKALSRHFRDVHRHKTSDRCNRLKRQELYSMEETFLKKVIRADSDSNVRDISTTSLPSEDVGSDQRDQIPSTINDVKLDESKYEKFPTECKELGCKSKGCFTKQKLKRHIFHVHIVRAQQHKPKQIWEECTYPTRCPYPNCKQTKLFHRKVVFRRHISRIHQAGRKEDPFNKFKYPINCPVEGCKSQNLFMNKSRLRFHVKSVHRRKLGMEEGLSSEAECSASVTASEQAVVCEVCGLVIVNAKCLENHMRGHTGEFLECEKCDAKFRSRPGLLQHKRAHHSDVPPVFQCPHCPKTFKVKQLLKVHMWRHTGHKRKVCEICSQRFMFKVLLDEHKRFVHYKELGLEPIRCKICNKIYSRPKYLQEHTKTHTGGGRFACTLCPYNTERSKDLQEHVSTVHCKEFPFMCNQCGKRFKLERRLVEHEKYHQDDYPFQCPICKRKCASGRTLAHHLRRKHSKTDLEEQASNAEVLASAGSCSNI